MSTGTNAAPLRPQEPTSPAQPPLRYAEVAVNVPLRPADSTGRRTETRGLTFHYHIPSGMTVQPGQLVWVSFGTQYVQGIVLALSPDAPVLETKPILAVSDPQPCLTPAQQQLVRWLADYYLCSVSEAAFTLLPPGIEQRSIVIVKPVLNAPPKRIEDLDERQRRVWNVVRQRESISLDEIRRQTHMPDARIVVDQLLRRGLVSKHQEIEPPRVRPKVVRTVRLAVDRGPVTAEIARGCEPELRKARLLRALVDAGQPLPQRAAYAASGSRRADATILAQRGLVHLDDATKTIALAAAPADVQAALTDLEAPPRRGAVGVLVSLMDDNGPVELGEICKLTGASAAQIAALAAKGLVRVEEQVLRRDPLAHRTFIGTQPPPLTPDQARVYDEVRYEIGKMSDPASPPPRPVLLHGVTGSGKTEIYLRALQDVLAQGRQAIIMVPEIALTPQTIHRFASRFPGNVAVLHSHLSMGEHFDEWRRIRDGLVDVVIGSRSAVFAPLPRLGLIVLDEEHEWTYKQTDVAPRYHAREVAFKLAELTRSLVLLGSATPDVVTYQRALDGEIKLLHMPARVVRPVAGGDGRGGGKQESRPAKAAEETGHAAPLVEESPLPPVEVVDLRAELRAGNRSIFSRALHNAMTVALAANQQIILFLNRRGTATFIMCRDCGHVLRCRSCDAPLAYHQAEDDLVCHQCNRRYLVPNVCPQCWSKRIKYFGIGTQKVEEEMRTLFPSARLLRWDRDVTAGKLAHETILDRFVRHEADVLIGTQMIAKGLDLPLVTLVGVVSADTALHLPDFRAGERTFQILTQVAGRAGRSTLGGKVIIQTYTPEHYAIRAASRHDYASFAAQELAFRARSGYPPFSHLARLLLQVPNKAKAQAEAERMHQMLKLRIAQLGLPDTHLIGPAPCFVSRLRGRYRWQIVVRAADVHPLFEDLTLPAGWVLDVDPVTLL